jgi:solute carrier family 25 (mitochondrial folate transporter), member 32
MKSTIAEARDEDQLKSTRSGSQAAWISMLLGAGSKIIASTITYPYQVVKSRLQQRQTTVSPILSSEVTITSRGYHSTWDCMLSMYRQDGLRSFYRGIVPNAIKVAPGAAVTFLVYEECLKILKSMSR